MVQPKKNMIVLSLGGSVIYPDSGISISVLSQYKRLLLDLSQTYKKIMVICGGGAVCRNYQTALKKVSSPEDDVLDWMGVFVSRTNGQLVRLMMGKDAYKKLITDPTEKIVCRKKIIVCGGYKPGWSTDFVAVRIAQTYGIKEMLNLSNISYVYDKDPQKNRTAKPLLSLRWKGFLDIIPSKWAPGLNVPFDPVASRLAAKNKMKVVFINGKSFTDIKKYFKKEKFKGTIIS